MFKHKHLTAAFGLVVIASLVLAACGGQATGAPQIVEVTKIVAGTPVTETIVITATPAPVTEPEKTKVLRINLGTYPDIVDPQKSSFVNEIAHLKLFYEGLTKFDTSLATVPGAAESWEYNADATELTFQLRAGLKYSDGSLLNAKRFEYSVLRNIDPATAGEYGSITDEILGAVEWRTSDGSDPALKDAVGVKALDASGAPCADYEQADCLTLKITLSKPAPYFHTIMGIWVAYPAKEENISDGGENWWNSSKYQIGNGPYILRNLEPFVRGYFVPNPEYWGDKAIVDIEFQYVTDTAVAFEAYKNNEFDIVPSAAEDMATIDADADLSAQHMVYPGACTTLIKFGLEGVYTDPAGNEYDSPFKDAKVREAFAYGFDAAGWARDVDSDLSLPTWTWIPPGFPGYDANSPLSFDPAKAQAALAASSYAGPDALNALGLKLTFADTPRNRQRSEWLVAKYKEILGVDIALDPVEATTFTAITKDPKTFPLLARQGWCADYPDPQNWLSVYWKSDTTFAARQGYKNEEFDALVAQADIELDPAKRMDLYAQAQQLLLADIPSAFGYNNKNHFLVKPWVKGLTTTPQDSDWPGSFDPNHIDIDTAMMP